MMMMMMMMVLVVVVVGMSVVKHHPVPLWRFYSASALLVMQTAVLARPFLFCHSVTFRYCVQTNEDTIVRFSASGRAIPLLVCAVGTVYQCSVIYLLTYCICVDDAATSDVD